MSKAFQSMILQHKFNIFFILKENFRVTYFRIIKRQYFLHSLKILIENDSKMENVLLRCFYSHFNDNKIQICFTHRKV